MKNKIFVSPQDNIAYLIDKIERVDSEEVFIDTDNNPQIFTDAVNLKLLKREAFALGKKLIFVTSSANLKDELEKAGFFVELKENDLLKDKEDNKGEDFGDAMNEINNSDVSFDDDFRSEDEKPLFLDDDETDEFFEKPFKANRNSDDEFDIFGKKKKKDNVDSSKFASVVRNFIAQDRRVTYGIFISIFVILGLILWILIPKMTVKIVPNKETLPVQESLTADTQISEIDFKEKRIPGQVVEVERELSSKFASSGVSKGATKASGKITIYNEFGPDPQPLIARTRFQSPDGKIFRIQKRVVVPGAKFKSGKLVESGKIEVYVVADEPGAEYNIEPTEFTIPGFKGTKKYEKFYAKSFSSMNGGSSGETLVISEKDLKKAKNELLEMSKKDVKDFLQKKIGGEFALIDSAISSEVVSFNAPPVGTATNEFDATLKLVYSIFTFKKSDAEEFVKRIITERIGDDKVIIPGSLKVSYKDGIISINKKYMDFIVNASVDILWKIDKERLKEELAGKDRFNIQKLLHANSAVKSGVVNITPFWSNKAPNNVKFITIEVLENN